MASLYITKNVLTHVRCCPWNHQYVNLLHRFDGFALQLLCEIPYNKIHIVALVLTCSRDAGVTVAMKYFSAAQRC